MAQIVEVANISRNGSRVLANDEEFLLPFADFPWFRDAAVGKIRHVEQSSPNFLFVGPNWV